ncbi:MAG: OmpH family outer membrane protein [Bacteroidota bacterium]
MKKLIMTAFALMLFAGTSMAQRYAFVDTEYILGNIPEYEDAQQQLDDLSEKWQREIEKRYQEIDQLYKEFQADAALMPEEMKKQREEEIVQQEREAKELQRKRFGQEGDLYQKRQELIKPIQEKIYNAIEKIATDKNYAFVFDKASNPKMLFADSRYDISDQVLEEMGYAY